MDQAGLPEVFPWTLNLEQIRQRPQKRAGLFDSLQCGGETASFLPSGACSCQFPILF